MPPKKACDLCYKRKIQCSIPSPDGPCNWCSHHDLQCTFDREIPRGSRKRATSSEIGVLLRRIDQLESALLANRDVEAGKGNQLSPASTVPTADAGTVRQHLDSTSMFSSPVSLDSPTLPGEVASKQTTHSGNVLGHHWYYRGMHILSEKGRAWIASKSDQAAVLGRHCLFGSTAGPFLPKPAEISPENLDLLNQLPDEEATRQILQCFLRSHTWLLFPVIDRHLFEKTIMIAYHRTQELNSSSWISAVVCILGLHAIASRSREIQALRYSIDGSKCANVAQALLPHLTGETTLENLQTVLMLHEFRRACGQWQNANLLHALACRMVCELEGHIDQATPSFVQMDSEQGHRMGHVRRLFWICYTQDKTISLRSGQPPLLTGNYCDLAHPEDYHIYYDYILQFSSGEGIQDHTRLDPDSIFPGDVRLSMIREEACRLLYSPAAINVNDAELLLRVRQLDDQLENWRLTVPLTFRPRLSMSQDRPLPSDKTNLLLGIFRMKLQFDYHYTLTAIHTTVRRCGSGYAESESIPEDLHVVLHSSIDLLLEASRSTLILLKVSIDLLEEGAFWDIVFYSPVAIMSLFVDILIHPSSDHAQADIAALTMAMSTIQTIPADKISPTDAEHIQEIADFIMETVRIGGRAIWKAKRNKRPNIE